MMQPDGPPREPPVMLSPVAPGCRHLVEAAFKSQDSLPLLRSLQTSLLRRGSSLASTTTARFGAQQAAADPSMQASCQHPRPATFPCLPAKRWRLHDWRYCCGLQV